MTSAGTSAQLRRLLLHMVLWVGALHGTAIAVYHLAGIPSAPTPVRTVFVVVWLAATFGLVSVYLRRIRVLRRGAGMRGGR